MASLNNQSRRGQPPKSSASGQILIEALIAIVVAGILIGGAAALIGQTLKADTQNKFVQVAGLLAGELTEKVASFAQQSWQGLYALTKSQAHVLTFSMSFTASPGEETVTVDSIPYTRSFSVENVCRDAATAAIAGTTATTCALGVEDPSTQKVTVAVSWPGGGPITVSRFLTRTANVAVIQTDWSGGVNPPGTVVPITDTTNQFDSADPNIDFTSEPGALQIQQ